MPIIDDFLILTYDRASVFWQIKVLKLRPSKFFVTLVLTDLLKSKRGAFIMHKRTHLQFAVMLRVSLCLPITAHN